ncbi:MAG: hypothetical protein ACRENP_07975, partial [Longimicrobiales bacterium]
MTMTRGLIGLAMAIALLTQPSARSGAPQDKSRPTSYQLISDALTAGRITEESAYKYRVFAAFGHPGLPEQYRGIDSLVTEVPRSVFAVGPKLRTFSPQTRAELMPFFLPPSAPGSWVALSAAPDVPREPMPVPGDDPVDDTSVTPVSERPSTIWFTKLAAGGAVKVWAQLHHRGDSAKAEKIADEITATIWPALTRVLGRPKSDMQYMLNSGGPELDIFLVRPSFTPADSARNVQRYGRSAPWRGVTMHTDTTTWPCKEAAFFILLNSVNPVGSATSKGLLQDVAHEITHAITGAKPLQGACEDYDWMSEATATWAEHKAYPKAQTEHGPAQGFLADVSLSLDERTPGDFNSHAYDSYLFPFYLMLTGKEAAIPAIWQAFATQAQLAGVNAG